MWQWDDFCIWIKKKQEKTTKIKRKKIQVLMIICFATSYLDLQKNNANDISRPD